MRKLLLAFNLLFFIVAQGQKSNNSNASLSTDNLKKIQGSYELGSPYAFLQGGVATYFTKEGKDYSILREGAFTYSCNMNAAQLRQRAGSMVNIKINGKYKDGLKVGEWNSSVLMKVNGEGAQIITKVNYKNGVPNGTWTSKQTSLQNKPIEEVSCKFKDGVMLGKFYYAKDDKKYEGFLDSNGFLDGRFSVTTGSIETIFECQHGIILKLIRRDASSGEVYLTKITESTLIDSLVAIKKTFAFDKKISVFENLENLEKNKANKLSVGSIDLFRIGVRYNNSSVYINEDFIKAFNNGLVFQSIPGDKLYKQEYYIDKYSWKSFLVINLE
jgi:hypothetical protein